MVVFLDVIILENLVVNLFLLHITANTIKIRTKFGYMFIAAILGSLYVITLVYPQLIFFSTLPFKIIAAVLIILIAFRKRSFILNLKAVCIFISYSMGLAGLCIFIQLILNQYNENYDIGSFYIENFSYKKLMISLMIIYMLINRLIIYIKDRKSLSTLIYDVEIVLKNSRKHIKAFLDTGNELREPATNLPVIIVEKQVFYDIDLNSYDKFHIPYKVVNGQGGTMEGIKPEYVTINSGEENCDKEVIIAFCEGKLSDINDYDALLSRGVIM
ncbi:sigma-E processing peptidase SpoIIGA [Clostridium sp. DJ247]|uniref:sigma-E processing peptidase SpoIIGA n=1 Tax=Clostridium sp. DJ247 TaxID=2726188 RepID=UPI0016299AE7|nr:sigma-E processing peptidase SpoIIGA [Clostridium sp. DJ247]MBC2578998.1 sigma-E processing peptidase SpoIIGA [Clostridium sp. DJ247]